jgi:cytochrome c oxidase assembly protein subunit 16
MRILDSPYLRIGEMLLRQLPKLLQHHHSTCLFQKTHLEAAVFSHLQDTHTHTHTYTQSDIHNMGVFPAKRFRASSYNGTMPARYRALLAKHPFALFGLPFTATMVLGSFFLTPATAIRYEKHDRKVKQLTKEEELGIGKDRRRIDLKEEYYVRTLSFMMPLTV